MSLSYGPSIATSQLELYLDASNIKSYPGSGNNWYDVGPYKSTFNSSTYTYPSIGSSGSVKYFIFVNNGTTINNIWSTTLNVTVNTELQYTRIGWFYLTSYSNVWSPIILNEIGNNSNMALVVNSTGKLGFYQYDSTQSNGTAQGDYGVFGSVTINTGQWYMGAITVNRITNSLSIYVNGALDTTTSINVIGNSGSNNIFIGGTAADSYGGDRMFKGNIASVSHYNRILTQTEILQNFNALRRRYGI